MPKGEIGVNKIKTNINSITGIIMIILSALNLILVKFDYTYRPNNYTVFYVINLIIAVFIMFFSIKYRSCAGKTSKIFASFLPIIVLVYVVTLLFSFDFINDYRTYSLLYYEMMLIVTLAFSLTIFFVYNKVLWLKIVVGVISFALILVFGFILLVTMFVSNIGESKVLQTVKSPDGTYVAVSISHDEGALGGDTCVRVRNNKNQIPLLLGSVIREEQQLWTGPWGKSPNLKWEDANTLLINNVSYDME